MYTLNQFHLYNRNFYFKRKYRGVHWRCSKTKSMNIDVFLFCIRKEMLGKFNAPVINIANVFCIRIFTSHV